MLRSDLEKIYIVDAFTDKPFSGNPAAVCILQEFKSDEVLQKIAAEMNLSETAFVRKEADGFRLRWFTPEVEVELCGHATLATSHILWQKGFLNPDKEAVYYTVFSGKLSASRKGDEIILNFPLIPVIDTVYSPELETALGIKPVYTGNCGTGECNYLIELKSGAEVRNLKPDLNLLSEIPKFGFIVTAISDDDDYDFISRYFAPDKGVDEDPVTGSAHCSLAHYWGKKLDKSEMNAFQASKRGGSMKVKLNGDRVLLTGKAVTVLEGNLLI